jgi:hypothetical protein
VVVVRVLLVGETLFSGSGSDSGVVRSEGQSISGASGLICLRERKDCSTGERPVRDSITCGGEAGKSGVGTGEVSLKSGDGRS